MAMTKVSQFVKKYDVDGYTLIQTLEFISRQVKVSPDYLLSVALVDSNAAEYLIGCVNRLQNQEKNIDV